MADCVRLWEAGELKLKPIAAHCRSVVAGITAAEAELGALWSDQLLGGPYGEARGAWLELADTTAPSSVASFGGSSGLRIVEQGYSQIGTMARMGAVLRIDTGKVAYRTLVTFDAVNASGRTVVHESFRQFQTQVVPTILPGASVAVGNASLLADATRRGTDDLDSVVVKIQVNQWVDPIAGDHGIGRVTAAVVGSSGERGSDGTGSLEFDVKSGNCADLVSRGVSLVFRDRTGAVVGGSLDNVPHDTCRSTGTAGERVTMTDPEIPAGPTSTAQQSPSTAISTSRQRSPQWERHTTDTSTTRVRSTESRRSQPA